MRLGDIALVRSGLVLSRKQARTTTAYRYPLLNLRSVNPNGYLDMDLIDIFDATEQLNPEYQTELGDIVIRLSTPYTAILIEEDYVGMVVSSNFVVIRAKCKYILPEYLFWLLNTTKVKRKIFENTTSNMLGAIKPMYFSNFEINLLSLNSQRKIGILNQLVHRENKLLMRLAKEKERYYAYILDECNKKGK